MIGSRNLGGLTVKGCHRWLQFGKAGVVGLNVGTLLVGITTTEGDPAYTVLINNHTGIENP